MELEHFRGVQASFLVFVPTFEQLPKCLPQIKRTLDGLEKDTVKQQISVYREDPKVVLVGNERLTQCEQQRRHKQLAALEDGLFEMIEVAGGGVSDYARELLLRASRSKTEVRMYTESAAPLRRYAQMLGVLT